MRLYTTIRADDDILRKHFDEVKKADIPYEMRRLMEKAIKIERKEQQIREEMELHKEQDS